MGPGAEGAFSRWGLELRGAVLTGPSRRDRFEWVEPGGASGVSRAEGAALNGPSRGGRSEREPIRVGRGERGRSERAEPRGASRGAEPREAI